MREETIEAIDRLMSKFASKLIDDRALFGHLDEIERWINNTGPKPHCIILKVIFILVGDKINLTGL